MSAVRHKRMGFHSVMSAACNKNMGYGSGDGVIPHKRMGYRSEWRRVHAMKLQQLCGSHNSAMSITPA